MTQSTPNQTLHLTAAASSQVGWALSTKAILVGDAQPILILVGSAHPTLILGGGGQRVLERWVAVKGGAVDLCVEMCV